MTEADGDSAEQHADSDASLGGRPAGGVSAPIGPAAGEDSAAGKPARRPTRWLRRTLILAVVWLPVLWVEWRDFRNEWWFVLFVPPAELALWLVAVLASTLLVRHTVARWWRTVTTVTCLCLLAACAYMTNWSVFDPSSYYAVRRQGFARISAMVESRVRANGAYLGERLPRYLADLSTTGRVEMVGLDVPVAFLPEFLGIPDGANGYLHVVGTSLPRGPIDLDGDPCRLSVVNEIGDGWYWC